MGNDTLANWRIVCLLTLGAFLGLSVAASSAGLLPGDLALRHELLEQANQLATWPPRLVDNAGTWRVLLPGSALLFLLSRAARRHWWLWCAILIGSSLIEHAFKFLVGRPRPSGFALGFPSGHATAAATFAVVVVYIASRERLGRSTRLGVQALVLAMMLAVGWARIVLHAHWPTDVLGGFFLGAGCAAAGAWWESSRAEAARTERAARA